jgi:hypothetical protein
MDAEQFEVGLFSRSPSGVRLVGRTDDQAAIRFVRDQIGEERAGDGTRREYEGGLTPLRQILAPILDELDRALAPARRDDDR